ncbi:uncharacterized protein LOC108200486 isoform X2 [Daucus carota subsp. sativus]|uniref:uncharacterized protein LOC108200486 isoform X2 n=1 Tax=Daucus carota subsp. sativus TaxID=79200 RepID=UPI003082CB8A
MALLLGAFMFLLSMAAQSNGASYCICKDGLSDAVLQKNIDYACGAGADCSAISQGGSCFNPNTVKDHCNYAVNSYYQKKGQATGTCDFSGTAIPSASPPALATTGCVFPSSGRVWSWRRNQLLCSLQLTLITHLFHVARKMIKSLPCTIFLWRNPNHTWDRHTGNRNARNRHTGNRNARHRHTGNRNARHRHTRDRNARHRHTRDRNARHRHTWDWYPRHRHTRDWYTWNRNPRNGDTNRHRYGYTWNWKSRHRNTFNNSSRN